MKHNFSDSTSRWPLPFINREPLALDSQEIQFLQKNRRSSNCVPYPRHIPTPPPVVGAQRRGLTYQAAAGHHRCMVLPVAGSALNFTDTTCSIAHHVASDKADKPDKTVTNSCVA